MVVTSSGSGLPRDRCVAVVATCILWVLLSGAAQGSERPQSGEAGRAAEVDRGWRLLKRGEYLPALRVFQWASAAAPRDAAILLGLGLACHLTGRSGPAITALERAIHFDASVGEAHALLGDLYVRRGELERAIHHYRQAGARGPGGVSVRARLERARRAYRAELEYDRLYSAHFVIQYPPSGIASESVHALAGRLERTYREIGRTLDYVPRETVTVIVYPQAQFRTRTESPAWVRALFDGVIHLQALEAEASLGISDDVLRHEYVHAAVDQLSAGRAPVWLNEGLALHLEGGGGVGAAAGSEAPAVAGTPAFPLHADFVALSPVDARAAYAHSYRATHRLIRQCGLTCVRALLEEISHTSEFSRAFATVFQIEFREFERRWLVSPRREDE